MGALDLITANNRQLRYECSWCYDDTGDRWFCMFGLDIYALPDYTPPVIEIPNGATRDPFGP